MILLRVFSFLLGLALVSVTLFSAVETFVLPRSAPDYIAKLVFKGVRSLFDLRLRLSHTYLERDRVMALFAPISLLALLPVWLIIILAGYAGMFWAVGNTGWFESFQISGSSLFTLGITTSKGAFQMVLELSEAVIGLIVITLLIAYLPTMYSAFSRRESAVTLLEVRAGNPPSVTQMLSRYHRIHGLGALGEQWRAWEVWFADIEESHTSLAALVFFRSPQPDHSWVIAAGTVLDSASLTLAALDIPHDPQADLCIRSGFLALRRIGDYFHIPYNPDPHYPEDPISITQAEFDAALDELAAKGLPLKPDREQAWRDFAGWRVNYDYVLLSLARLTMAPLAPWTSDRTPAPREARP
ncbi:MAG TPA: hypothetical protein VF498_20605 [Anaerolineales bacterium]